MHNFSETTETVGVQSVSQTNNDWEQLEQQYMLMTAEQKHVYPAEQLTAGVYWKKQVQHCLSVKINTLLSIYFYSSLPFGEKKICLNLSAVSFSQGSLVKRDTDWTFTWLPCHCFPLKWIFTAIMHFQNQTRPVCMKLLKTWKKKNKKKNSDICVWFGHAGTISSDLTHKTLSNSNENSP